MSFEWTRASRHAALTLALALTLASGCASGAGDVRVFVSGEEAAVSGWPFEADGETIGFVDGWSLDVTRVLVAIEAFELRTREGDDAGLDTDAVVADLSGGDPLVWEEGGVPAQRWSDVRYRIAPPSASARGVGGASAADVAEMVAAAVDPLLQLGIVIVVDCGIPRGWIRAAVTCEPLFVNWHPVMDIFGDYSIEPFAILLVLQHPHLGGIVTDDGMMQFHAYGLACFGHLAVQIAVGISLAARLASPTDVQARNYGWSTLHPRYRHWR